MLAVVVVVQKTQAVPCGDVVVLAVVAEDQTTMAAKVYIQICPELEIPGVVAADHEITQAALATVARELLL
jgi:arginase family enzyme